MRVKFNYIIKMMVNQMMTLILNSIIDNSGNDLLK